MLRTKSGLPKHCSWAPDRHGKRRVRFRKSGRFLLPLARFSPPQTEHASDASERYREVPTPPRRQAAQRTHARTHQ